MFENALTSLRVNPKIRLIRTRDSAHTIKMLSTIYFKIKGKIQIVRESLDSEKMEKKLTGNVENFKNLKNQNNSQRKENLISEKRKEEAETEKTIFSKPIKTKESVKNPQKYSPQASKKNRHPNILRFKMNYPEYLQKNRKILTLETLAKNIYEEIPGIGQMRALKLLKRFPTMAEALEHMRAADYFEKKYKMIEGSDIVAEKSERARKKKFEVAELVGKEAAKSFFHFFGFRF